MPPLTAAIRGVQPCTLGSSQSSDHGQNVVYNQRVLWYLLGAHLNTRKPHVDNLSLKLFDTGCCKNASETCKIAILDDLEYS